MIWLALAMLIAGLLLTQLGRSTRAARGLGQGKTIALDNRTLYSVRYGLAGRPDRIIEGNIPEEWKSGGRVYDSHRAQLGCYFILIEEETGVSPSHGYISLGDGRQRIANTPELREWVLGVAEQIRAARRDIQEQIPVRQPAAKCRGCGMRDECGQEPSPPSHRGRH